MFNEQTVWNWMFVASETRVDLVLDKTRVSRLGGYGSQIVPGPWSKTTRIFIKMCERKTGINCSV